MTEIQFLNIDLDIESDTDLTKIVKEFGKWTGVGIGSFAYLNQLRPDYIKIDGGFTRESVCIIHNELE